MQERYPTLVHHDELPQGGHFAAQEQRAIYADESRASSAPARAARDGTSS
ncbi:MAG: hypothetical protein AVDCRST_MAG07-3416 [uncultured Frankineae bacterium]|uniref:Uncharacterized protein n=1 Tax=uncultured Frankineae bacterium TaxID=437475 RepID=A0A6J4MDZ0_9ACTN|nr:MAG: hypothetical protein AVDCRST_MAG07-3416 [uncultured Frankineae bacterium]